MADRTRARSAARGGVLDGERALAPDLARGLMILLIALSNTVFHLWAADHGPSGWHPVDGDGVDRVVQFAMIVGLRSGTLLAWSAVGTAALVLPAVVLAVAIAVGGVPDAAPGAATRPTVEL